MYPGCQFSIHLKKHQFLASDLYRASFRGTVWRYTQLSRYQMLKTSSFLSDLQHWFLKHMAWLIALVFQLILSDISSFFRQKCFFWSDTKLSKCQFKDLVLRCLDLLWNRLCRKQFAFCCCSANEESHPRRLGISHLLNTSFLQRLSEDGMNLGLVTDSARSSRKTRC